jgi:hypothetical protein
MRCRTALEAASAASFQPVNALTKVGLRKVGFDSQFTDAGIAIAHRTLSEQKVQLSEHVGDTSYACDVGVGRCIGCMPSADSTAFFVESTYLGTGIGRNY